MHTELAHEISPRTNGPDSRIRVPFAERVELDLKKVGHELIVAGGSREADYHPPGRARPPPPDRRELERRNARGELRTMTAPDPAEWRRLARHSSERECVELCPICRAADVLRATASPELRGQWQDVQREALLTMKAVIDRDVERMDDRATRARPQSRRHSDRLSGLERRRAVTGLEGSLIECRLLGP